MKNPNSLSALLHKRGGTGPWLFSWSFSGCTEHVHVVFVPAISEPDAVFQVDSPKNEVCGSISSLTLLARLFVQPRIWLTFWSASEHCQFMSNCSSSRMLSPSLQGCPQYLSLYGNWALLWRMDIGSWLCWTLWCAHEPTSQPVPKSLWIAFHPSSKSTTQLGVMWKLAPNPVIYVLDKYTKCYWLQYASLRDTTHCWVSLGDWTIDCNSFDMANSLSIYPSNPYVSQLETRRLYLDTVCQRSYRSWGSLCSSLRPL